jgi:hypothetical protein
VVALALVLEADQEMSQEERSQNRRRDQKTDQQLLASAGIFERVAIDLGATGDAGGCRW